MKTLVTLSCVCALLMGFGCGGGDGGGGPTDTAESLTAEGWELFEQGQYEAAKDKFNDALGLDATYADAHNGLGWSNAKLDLLADALDGFADAISHGLTSAEVYAGQAPVYLDYTAQANHYASAVSSANTALGKERRFAFSHDTSFDWKDLMVIMAQGHFGTKAYTNANAWVDSLPGGVPADPGSPDFVSDLAAEIERLEDLYGG
jgi:tetratricopeptide (TPR) repeat protein